MAKTLSKSGILDGQTIQPGQVTQSIDAFTGTEDYDITISGSLTVTGSTSIDGDVFINPTSATTGTSVLTINPTTGKIFRTGSYSSGGSGPTPSLEAVTTAGNTTSNSIRTGPITSTGQISASGNLFTNVDDSGLVFGASSFKVVTYDTATGRFYRTGSFSSVLVSSGSKYNFGTDEIVYEDDNGDEGVGIKGTGSKTVEITDKDGNGGKLDLSGGDGNGEIVIGRGGAIQGDTSKGKISPVVDSNIQEDGHFQVLKNDGTKGQISTNIKAGTNTTIIDDNYNSTGYIELTGSIYTKSNITASGNISASGNLIAKKIIVDAEGSDPSNLDIQVGSPGTGIASIPAGNQIGIYTSNSYRLVATDSKVEISTDLQCKNLNVTGSTPSHITASGNISASGKISGDTISIMGDTALSTDINGYLYVSSSKIFINNLPAADPGALNQLYTTQLDGVRIIAVSDG